jgi:hypothetical protein
MRNYCLKLQETPFSKGPFTILYKKMLSAQQIRHLQYHSTINVNQTLSFDPSNFRQRAFSRPICEVLSTRICNTTNKA